MESIFEAVAKTDLEALKKIVADGVSVDVVDSNGRTSLMHAAIDGKETVAKYLIDQGSKLNASDGNGYTALHFAAQDYRVAIATMLLDAGAGIDPQDSYGNTPLWRATFNSQGRGEMIKLLLARGAEKNLKNKNGKAPVDLARTIANYNLKPFFE